MTNLGKTWETLTLHLTVQPRYRPSTFGRRVFWVAAVRLCETLPDRLRDPTLSSDSFRGNYIRRGIICELINALSAVELLLDAALCTNAPPTSTKTLTQKSGDKIVPRLRSTSLNCWLTGSDVVAGWCWWRWRTGSCCCDDGCLATSDDVTWCRDLSDAVDLCTT